MPRVVYADVFLPRFSLERHVHVDTDLARPGREAACSSCLIFHCLLMRTHICATLVFNTLSAENTRHTFGRVVAAFRCDLVAASQIILPTLFYGRFSSLIPAPHPCPVDASTLYFLFFQANVG